MNAPTISSGWFVIVRASSRPQRVFDATLVGSAVAAAALSWLVSEATFHASSGFGRSAGLSSEESSSVAASPAVIGVPSGCGVFTPAVPVATTVDPPAGAEAVVLLAELPLHAAAATAIATTPAAITIRRASPFISAIDLASTSVRTPTRPSVRCDAAFFTSPSLQGRPTARSLRPVGRAGG